MMNDEEDIPPQPEELSLLEAVDDDEDDQEFPLDLMPPPKKGKHNYHNSRIVLPPREAMLFEQSIDQEIDIEEAMLENEIDGYTKFINFFGYMIPFIYGAFFILILSLYITGFIEQTLKEYLIWGLILCLFLGAVLGMYSIYKYGVIADHVDDMKFENDDYKNQLKKLEKQNEKFKQEVKTLKTTVSELQHDATHLAEQTEQFEGLVGELKEISKENKDVVKILDDTNQIFADMRKVVLENERAHLLTAFYECAFRDDENAMSKKEYQSFLVRLTKKQRERFAQLGSFEDMADETGHIDVVKFQDILEKVLEDVDQLLREEFDKHSRA
eukprot:CAMPEP_0197048750 /NCGR_PEP_ID=MMETSP1384-20130603/24027_1 /TAXON_ID=29189 /ORGANISM="Ammonia sp." /LENGTH=327 /DNA_ID=CAMNT_0042480929 /DNA_START=65 /DNA_END=1048 /DNA_ORIENTATION=-